MEVASRKGEPVMVLVAVLALWVLTRAVLWTSPFPDSEPDRAQLAGGVVGQIDMVAANSGAREEAVIEREPGASTRSTLTIGHWQPRPSPSHLPSATPHRPATAAQLAGVQRFDLPGPAPAARPHPSPVPLAVSTPTPNINQAGQRAGKRWRVDGWLFWREGVRATGLPGVDRPASYGASQAGLVLRRDLARDGRSFAFARIAKALDRDGETEVALGLSARPVRSVPVGVRAEMRASRFGGGWSLRPAAAAVTEILPVALGPGLRLEAYGQAGYVGGEFATAFADGQLRLERRVVDVGTARLTVGAGAWGGAQKGASRIDVGPTVGLDFDLSGVPLRIRADYRIRVTGNAEPDSGIAVTLSSGF